MKNYWLNLNRFLSPDAVDGGGNGHEEGTHSDDTDDGSDPDGTGGDKGDPEPEPEPKASSLTKEDLTSILASVIPAAVERGQPAAAERTYTQAEINKMLNVWEPSTAFLKKMGIAEPTADNLVAIQEMRDSLIKQANTMAEARIQQIITDKMKGIEEVQQYVSEQRAAATINAFYEKNPDLKQYEEIVDAVSAKMEKNGFKAPTQEAVYAEVAKGARAVLQRMNVKVAPGKPAAKQGNRMSHLAGSGSNSGEGTGAKKRNPDMAIFDDDGE